MDTPSPLWELDGLHLGRRCPSCCQRVHFWHVSCHPPSLALTRGHSLCISRYTRGAPHIHVSPGPRLQPHVSQQIVTPLPRHQQLHGLQDAQRALLRLRSAQSGGVVLLRMHGGLTRRLLLERARPGSHTSHCAQHRALVAAAAHRKCRVPHYRRKVVVQAGRHPVRLPVVVDSEGAWPQTLQHQHGACTRWAALSASKCGNLHSLAAR